MKNIFKRKETLEDTAKNTYLLCRYGEIKTPEEIADRVIRDIKSKIKNIIKGLYPDMERETATSWKIPDCPNQKEVIEIVKKYFEERDYTIQVVDKDLLPDYTGRPLILINWNYET